LCDQLQDFRKQAEAGFAPRRWGGIKPSEGPEATGGGSCRRRMELSLRVGTRRAAEAGRSAAQDRSG